MRGVRKALAVGPAPPAEDHEVSTATTAAASARGRASEERVPGPRSRQLLVRLALATSLTAFAVALGIVLAGAPLTVASANGVPANLAVSFISHPEVGCEPSGVVPQGTQAVRVSLSANVGPWVSVRILSGSTLVTEGEHEAGWGVDETVTVPVKRVASTIANGRICTTVGPVVEPLQVNGARVQTSPRGPTAIELRMEYLRPDSRSWLSLVASAAHNMGLDHAPGGAWVAYLVMAVMLMVSALCTGVLLRLNAEKTRTTAREDRPTRQLFKRLDPGRRALRAIPRAAWICALVASLSAACWSVITPPFQAPDEPSHFAYAQLLAEAGRLPDSNSGAVSKEEAIVMKGLHQSEVEWHSETPIITSQSAQRELREDLTLPLDRTGPGGAGVAASEPPLYYALASLPYDLGSSGTLLDSLALMRLLSALMAGVTALFVFLFVREALPGVPWAWTVGGLAAAVTPLLGFTSGAVTPEALFYVVSAAMFFCLARAFRRGLTRKRAVAIGVVAALGFLTKLNFIGLVPGIALGLVILGFRGERAAAGKVKSRHAFGPMVLATALAISPVCVYVASNLLNHHHLLGIVSSTAATGPKTEHGSILVDLSYVWEFYLPHLPGMTNYFPGLSSFHQLWFDRAVGFYGWLDTSFPTWVDNLALIPAGLIGLLGLRTLVARRSTLVSRLPEILVYLVMAIGLMALIGQDFYIHRNVEGAGWAQPRYLVPLLPMLTAALVLAARGAGRRVGPAVGALIVVLFLAQDVFGQLLTAARFYV
jgi:hypothetical protein